MPKINTLKINGFKSIYSESISLGKLNVFIGTNGAGKSNLLEAIAMLSSSFEGGVDYERLARRGARLSAPEVFRSAFKNKDRKNTLSIEAEFENSKYSMSMRTVGKFSYNAESYKRIPDEVALAGRSNNGSTLYGKRLPSKIDQDKSIMGLYSAYATENEDILKALRDYAIYAPSTPILRGAAPDNSNKSPLGLYGGRLAEALREVINQKQKHAELRRFFRMFDWFKEIGSTQEIKENLISDYVSFGGRVVRYVDKYMKSNFNELYAYDVSEGALFILFVILLLSHEDGPKIFALDNIDSALNPGLVRELMNHIAELIEESDHQIFITTHNPTTLDSIDLFNKNHRLFVVERSDDGSTKIRRITTPDGVTKEQWQESYFGMRLSEIWLSGAIGGLPRGF